MRVGWGESTKRVMVTGLLALAGVGVGSSAWASPGDRNEAPWAPHIRMVDAAVAAGDVGAADRALHRAYLAALPYRGWEGLVEVGDAYRRAGDSLGTQRQSRARAREYYLAALFRARQHGSLVGVVRTAEGFAAMGDREPLTMCLRVAEALAARLTDALEREQARASIERLSQRLYAMDGSQAR